MRILLAVLFALLLSEPSFAAVTYDTDAVDEDTASGTSTSTSITVGAGSNIAVLVCVSLRAAAQDVTDVTVGGVQAVEVANQANETSNILMSAWVAVLGSSSGSKTVNVTWTPTDRPKIMMISFHGVDQATPTGTTQKSTSDGATSTTTTAVSSSATGLVADCLTTSSAATNKVVGANQTEQIASLVDINGSEEHASTEPGGASITMSWSWTTAIQYAHVAVPLIAASTRRPSPPILLQ
jgi:hypothetical protein